MWFSFLALHYLWRKQNITFNLVWKDIYIINKWIVTSKIVLKEWIFGSQTITFQFHLKKKKVLNQLVIYFQKYGSIISYVNI